MNMNVENEVPTTKELLQGPHKMLFSFFGSSNLQDFLLQFKIAMFKIPKSK